MADLTLSLIAKDELTSVFGGAAGAVVRLKDAFVDMAKAAAESERIGAQLKLVAGDLTEAFRAQSEAMSQQLGVDDDLIQKMQTILLRYGEAPGKVKETTKALLDYAAATGQDAVSATEAMVRGVEKGTGSIRALGIQYQETGGFSKDLEHATKALGARYHDGASTNAETLVGQVNAAKVAFEDLQKTYGAMIDAMVKKTEVLETSTSWLRGLALAAKTGQTGVFLGASLGTLFGSESAARILDDAMGSANQLAKKGDAEADVTLNAAGGGSNRAVGKGGANSQAFKDDLWLLNAGVGLKSSLRDDMEADKARAEMDDREAQREQERLRKTIEVSNKIFDTQMTEVENLDKAREQAKLADDRRELQGLERAKLIAKQQEQVFEQAGLQMGAVFVQGLVSQINKLAKGGEFDVAEFLGTVFQGALGVLGGVLNFIMPGAGGIVSALGGLFRHDGGTIGYFHTGGMPATTSDERLVLAQEGEYMLSRQDVARMGGQAGVEAAKRGGGGGGTVIIQAVDAESVQRLMEGRGGRAAVNAVRLGRGGFSQLIRGRG